MLQIYNAKLLILQSDKSKNSWLWVLFGGRRRIPPHFTLGTGDAEIGWRPAPEKNIETMPCWGKNSPENCLVDLGRETRTSTQSRRLVRRKGASWSPHWPSGANLLAHMQLKCILNMPL